MNRNIKGFMWVALGVALLAATFVSPFASSSPDGLDRVANDQGFVEKAEAEGAQVWRHAPLAEYAFPGVKNRSVATGLAGLVGTAGIFALVLGGATLLRKGKKD